MLVPISCSCSLQFERFHLLLRTAISMRNQKDYSAKMLCEQQNDFDLIDVQADLRRQPKAQAELRPFRAKALRKVKEWLLLTA